MKRTFAACALLTAALLTAACSVNSVGVISSTSPLPPADQYRVSGAVQTSVVTVTAFGFVVSGPSNPTRAAIDKALIQAKSSDAMINAQIDSTVFPIGPVGVTQTQISGQTIKYK